MRFSWRGRGARPARADEFFFSAGETRQTPTPLMLLDPAFVYSNYAEAGLWTVMGAAALLKGHKDRSGIILGLTLIAFGASDLIESRTGAWYRPWWLFAWKAGCVLSILVSGIDLLRKRRRESP